MSAYCTCTAGLGQTCNHIAGILFRLEHANRMGLSKLSCTSLPCTWNVPSESVTYGPRRISDMQVKKSRYGKSDKARPLVSSSKRNFQPLPNTENQDPLKAIGSALVNILPNACLFKGLQLDITSDNNKIKDSSDETSNNQTAKDSYDATSDNHTAKAREQSVPEEKVSLLNYSKQFGPGQETEFFARLPQLSENEILQLSDETTKQAESEIWYEVRRGRITASRFYSVYTKVNTIRSNRNVSKEPDVSPLLRSLLGETGLSADPNKCPRAIKHGCHMEPVAKAEYERQNQQRHTNFSLKDCGLFIHKDYQFLGASPDILVSCSCCGDGTVEIKCPLTPPCDQCNPNFCSCSSNNVKFLEFHDGKHSLKRNHAYYGQIQGQMAITGRKYCDFFVYTSSAIIITKRGSFLMLSFGNLC